MVHCVTYVLLLLAAVCLVRTMKVITFSFCVRRCTSCERCVCCSVNGKQETCLSWNVHGNQEELLYYSVDGNWEAWLCWSFRRQLGSVPVLGCWRKSGSVPLMLTESDSPTFRNCDIRTEILAAGSFEILISCHVLLFKTARLFIHLFCYYVALLLINLDVVT